MLIFLGILNTFAATLVYSSALFSFCTRRFGLSKTIAKQAQQKCQIGLTTVFNYMFLNVAVMAENKTEIIKFADSTSPQSQLVASCLPRGDCSCYAMSQ